MMGFGVISLIWIHETSWNHDQYFIIRIIHHAPQIIDTLYRKAGKSPNLGMFTPSVRTTQGHPLK